MTGFYGYLESVMPIRQILNSCSGGCLLDGITDTGDLLVPEERVCFFYKNIGAAVVKELADNAIAKYLN